MSKTLDARDVRALFEFPRIMRMLNDALSGEATEKFAKILDDEPNFIFDPLDEKFNFASLHATETGVFYELGYRQNGDAILCGLTLSLEADADEIEAFDAGMARASEQWPGWKRDTAEVEGESFVLWHRTAPLDDFVARPAPIEALRTFFLLCVDELAAVQKTHPALPWR
ncbi:MAG: hypothetical protein RMM53_09920 [Bacteroidia bacterium]|nr:hypothetical protein [Bacteroidia bacterium]